MKQVRVLLAVVSFVCAFGLRAEHGMVFTLADFAESWGKSKGLSIPFYVQAGRSRYACQYGVDMDGGEAALPASIDSSCMSLAQKILLKEGNTPQVSASLVVGESADKGYGTSLLFFYQNGSDYSCYDSSLHLVSPASLMRHAPIKVICGLRNSPRYGQYLSDVLRMSPTSVSRLVTGGSPVRAPMKKSAPWGRVAELQYNQAMDADFGPGFVRRPSGAGHSPLSRAGSAVLVPMPAARVGELSSDFVSEDSYPEISSVIKSRSFADHGRAIGGSPLSRSKALEAERVHTLKRKPHLGGEGFPGAGMLAARRHYSDREKSHQPSRLSSMVDPE